MTYDVADDPDADIVVIRPACVNRSGWQLYKHLVISRKPKP